VHLGAEQGRWSQSKTKPGKKEKHKRKSHVTPFVIGGPYAIDFGEGPLGPLKGRGIPCGNRGADSPPIKQQKKSSESLFKVMGATKDERSKRKKLCGK